MKQTTLTILGIIMLALILSCAKEPIVITPMYRMYTESTNLPRATLDSINNFTKKLSAYVVRVPESRQDIYFDPTLDNLRYAASIQGCIVIDTPTSISIGTKEEQ